ncbi:TetR/AcrR family transcriptional regulator [Mycobacterium parmense]|uniref:TetR/AcrR family transcriptional regulator n=1 Tax=Mycobacterium parmense TaxID=185642 RepID=UPI001E3886D5|nr:TetR/AcrR family transcriptional regulator [Mycobacterium parmense]
MRRINTPCGSSPFIIGATDSVAELPWREAVPPLFGGRYETGRVMTEGSERRAGNTRHRLIAAASRQFAHRPYSMVSLDDILAEAELTKGAMYFHFPSKQALAMAIIDDVTEMSGAAVTELLARKMSGLETLIDLAYFLAVQDTQDEVARAGARLLETLDNTTAIADARWQSWVEFVITLVEKAVGEGDVSSYHEVEDIAKMLVSLWVGVRRISDLNQPERYLDNLESTWTLALTCFTNPDRIDYFTQFIKRRHALAVKKVSVDALALDLQTAAATPVHAKN